MKSGVENSRQSELLQMILRAIPADFADPEADYHKVRETFALFHGHPVSDDVSIDIEILGGTRCGFYSLAGAWNGMTVLHCHGGAFVSTRLDEYHFYAELIARQTGCRVVMPDYRLAPEYPYPAAHDDCFAAWRELCAAGIDPATVVIMGESCGGSLGLQLILRARDEGLPLPRCFVSLTGWFDLAVARAPSVRRDPFLTAEWVRNRARDYLQDSMPLDDPRVSPAYADLEGLPPLLLQIGEYDTVRYGALALAERAAHQGVPVTVKHWPGMVQGWHGLANAGVPEALSAWEEIRRFIDDCRSDDNRQTTC